MTKYCYQTPKIVNLCRVCSSIYKHILPNKLNTIYKCENNYTRNKLKSCEKSFESKINKKWTILHLENLQIMLQNQIFGAWECEIE